MIQFSNKASTPTPAEAGTPPPTGGENDDTFSPSSEGEREGVSSALVKIENCEQ